MRQATLSVQSVETLLPALQTLDDLTVGMMADLVLTSILEAYKPARSESVRWDSAPLSLLPRQFVHFQPLRWKRNPTQARSANTKKSRLVHDDSFGSFVSVKSYTRFCLTMITNIIFQEKTTHILSEAIQSLFPREAEQTNPSEKPRSAHLSRLLQAEFSALTDVEFVHQCSVVPQGKSNEQDVDKACIHD